MRNTFLNNTASAVVFSVPAFLLGAAVGAGTKFGISATNTVVASAPFGSDAFITTIGVGAVAAGFAVAAYFVCKTPRAALKNNIGNISAASIIGASFGAGFACGFQLIDGPTVSYQFSQQTNYCDATHNLVTNSGKLINATDPNCVATDVGILPQSAGEAAYNNVLARGTVRFVEPLLANTP